MIFKLAVRKHPIYVDVLAFLDLRVLLSRPYSDWGVPKGDDLDTSFMVFVLGEQTSRMKTRSLVTRNFEIQDSEDVDVLRISS